MKEKNSTEKFDIARLEFDENGAYKLKEILDLELLDSISGGRGNLPLGVEIDINFCWGSNAGCSSTPLPPRPRKPSDGEEGDDDSDYE